MWCKGCGSKQTDQEYCYECSQHENHWISNRFQKGSRVITPLGSGTVIDIDLPHTDVWRWVVKLDKPWLEGQLGDPAFFDNDVKVEE